MKKTNYNKGTYTILTTSTEGFKMEDFEEFCEDNGIDAEEDGYDFDDWCREEADNNYECDLENIKYCKAYNVPVVVTGKLGLWDGRHEIMPKAFDSVYDAIMACLGRDTLDVEAKFIDGEIVVNAYHHDGCNCFTINALSAKGTSGWINRDGAELKKTDVKRLPYLYAI